MQSIYKIPGYILILLGGFCLSWGGFIVRLFETPNAWEILLLRSIFFFLAVSIFLYASVYTPLKLITPLSVFVGAIPGALPFMLGWVAATGEVGIEAVILFLMQFFWQFPHFWSIGWMQNKDYENAGFKMLPTGKKDKSTTSQIIFYSIFSMAS